MEIVNQFASRGLSDALETCISEDFIIQRLSIGAHLKELTVPGSVQKAYADEIPVIP
jgi:hypothetical protein